MDGTDRSEAAAVGSPSPELLWGKLRPPALRAGLIPRAGLLSLLQAGLAAKLCLLDAPAGFGKTTLLGQWRMAAGGDRVAWVSMDEGDNGPGAAAPSASSASSSAARYGLTPMNERRYVLYTILLKGHVSKNDCPNPISLIGVRSGIPDSQNY